MSNVFLFSQQTQMHVHKYNHIHKTHTTHNPPFLMMLGMRAGGDMKSVSMCTDAEKVKELQENLWPDFDLWNEEKSQEASATLHTSSLPIVCSLFETTFGSSWSRNSKFRFDCKSVNNLKLVKNLMCRRSRTIARNEIYLFPNCYIELSFNCFQA